MGISYWKILLFLVIITALAIFIIPSVRELGRLYFKDGRFKKAEAFLAEEYREDPDDSQNSLRYLKALDEEEKHEQFEDLSKKVDASSPNNIAIQEEIAHYYEGSMQPEKAEEYWEKILKEDPSQEEAREKLIYYYQVYNQKAKLAELYEQDIEKNYANLQEYYALGEIYLNKKQRQKAEKLYQALIQKFPNEVFARVRLAQIYDYEKQEKPLLDIFKQVVELDPNNETYALQYVQYLYKYHHYDESLKYALCYSKKFPDMDSFEEFIAGSYLGLGQKENALKAYEKFYAKHPDKTGLLLSMAQIAIDLGKDVEARKYVNMYISKEKETPRAYYLLGLTYHKHSKAEAYKAYHKSVLLLEGQKNLSETDVVLYLNLLWELGYQNKAERKINKYLAVYPRNKDILQMAARIAIQNKEYDKAGKYIELYKQENGDDKTYHELLANLYLAEKKWDQAAWELRKLIDRYPKNWDYYNDYAYSMGKLNRWAEAAKAYQLLLNSNRLKREYLGDYRNALIRSGTILESHFFHEHDPQTARHFEWGESAKIWINKDFFVEIESNQERHMQDLYYVGSVPCNVTIAGYLARLGWLPTNTLQLSAYFHDNFLQNRGFAEWGGACDFFLDGEIGNMPYTYILIAKGYYNRIIRSPTSAYAVEGRMSDISIETNASIFQRFDVGYAFKTEWYTIDGKQNKVNGKSGLGHKYFNRLYTSLLIYENKQPSWYLSFNMFYEVANWVLPFGAAQNIIDFIVAENMIYYGPFLGIRMSPNVQITGSVQRKKEFKRDFWATYQDISLDMWLLNNLHATFQFEYIYHDSTVNGTGNSYLYTAIVQWVF